MFKTALFFTLCGMIIGVILYECVQAWATSGASGGRYDCRPHIYLSGIVEIRGAPMGPYVVAYKDLPELIELLDTVRRDLAGEIRWMGHD